MSGVVFLRELKRFGSSMVATDNSDSVADVISLSLSSSLTASNADAPAASFPSCLFFSSLAARFFAFLAARFFAFLAAFLAVFSSGGSGVTMERCEDKCERIDDVSEASKSEVS